MSRSFNLSLTFTGLLLKSRNSKFPTWRLGHLATAVSPIILPPWLSSRPGAGQILIPTQTTAPVPIPILSLNLTLARSATPIPSLVRILPKEEFGVGPRHFVEIPKLLNESWQWAKHIELYKFLVDAKSDFWLKVM